MKLFLLGCLILVSLEGAFSDELLGSKKCTWGPSYWCGSLKAANECGAMHHCITTVWKNQKTVESSSDELCDLCKDAIQQVHDMLANKKTQAQIHQYLDQVCQAIPDSTIAQECQQAVDQNFDQIVQMILNELDPQQICSLLGLCGTHKSVRFIHKMDKLPLKKTVQPVPRKKERLGASPQCVLCEFVMREVDRILQGNTTEKEIIAALDKVCSILPGTIAAECKSFVDQYGPAIITLLANELKPSMVCTALGLCAGNNPTTLIGIAGTDECVMCKMVVQYLVSILEQDSTKKEIQEALDKVCNFLPDSYSPKCQQFVNTYEPVLIDLLLKRLDPGLVCQTMKLCTGGKLKVKPKTLKYIPLNELK